ncbi:MAG: VOC family protein [Flavisolibacter sp.]
MAMINPYLNFMGRTEEAFNFYRSVFGGEFTCLQRIRDIRNIPGGHCMRECDKEKILFIALPIGKGNVLMGTDALESMGHCIRTGNNFSISVQAEGEAEAKHLFGKLSCGGEIIMPLDKAFWGAYFGMIIDPFGIQWLIMYG